MTTTQEIRALKKEMKELAAMVETTAKHAGNGHSNIVGFDTDDLRRMAKQAGSDVRSYISTKGKQAGELRDSAEEKIATNPFKSVGIAVASGLLLGALLGRR